ncbi:hypothetical protein [Streptomyces pseudovenezuelae]|uniref:hypothetical protein n=1 Tax=Streptomyces pseudovenezuelae TaxID=67350 RepID=UPI002E324F49|nr:hypothetical protein [Streptomyces pseudovenezuelae]
MSAGRRRRRRRRGGGTGRSDPIRDGHLEEQLHATPSHQYVTVLTGDDVRQSFITSLNGDAFRSDRNTVNTDTEKKFLRGVLSW